MNTYSVTVSKIVRVPGFVEVEADNLDDAMLIALDLSSDAINWDQYEEVDGQHDVESITSTQDDDQFHYTEVSHEH